MVKLISRGAAAALFALSLASIAAAQQPFDSSAWDIHAAEWRIEPYRGRSALFLRDGSAWLKRTRFQNGTIEFDVVFSNVSGFPGIAFRAATHSDHELFYLRQSLSGPHATQYTPVLHGQWAWQIYSGPQWEGTTRWTYDRWMHVKLLVRDSRAELFVDGDGAVQVIRQLHGPSAAGEIGLFSGNGARFANVVVRPDAETPEDMTTAPQAAVLDSTPATVVRSWRVSAPFPESTLVNLTSLPAVPGGGAWTRLGVEERGIANFARLTGIGDGRNTVVAAVTLTSERDRIVRVRFGYSDRVRVFLNGRLLYAGNAGYGTRDAEFLGIVGLYDELALPVRRGPNELWFAVSETFAGWAVTADLPDRAGITVTP
jgi:hypothetical protein